MIDAATMIRELLGAGHAVRFRASGDSMWPLIQSNDYLHVEPVSARSVTRGDVILAMLDRGLTAHRVVRVDSGSVVTRGDNIANDDAAVPESRVLGRVTHAERDGRHYRVGRKSQIMLAFSRFRVRVAARFFRQRV